jgi:hypothetical protein
MQLPRKIQIVCLVCLFIVLVSQGCSSYFFRNDYKDANTLIHETENLITKPFLKAHLKSGQVVIFRDTWTADSTGHYVSGKGSRYDLNRTLINEGDVSVSTDSIAIFETNTKFAKTEGDRIVPLTILAGADVILGIICLTNPKACFGSCPTFYLNEKDNFHYSDAEGFSNAIAPSLEYFDIDALNNKPVNDNTFSITMKNEALETHCVNDVRLLAVPRSTNERIFQTPENEFYRCHNIFPVKNAKGNDGDITPLLSNDDRVERVSHADGHNLSAKEEIILSFDSDGTDTAKGLIISFRQTLMTTFLIYNAISYMGDEVADIFTKLEKSEKKKKDFSGQIHDELGDIDVYLLNYKSCKWEYQGGINETGPIAFNHQLLPLKNVPPGDKITIKLIMNKGLWRLDYLALTNIMEKVCPIEISPDQILNKNNYDAEALKLLEDPNGYLISMPGSVYKFNFTLPSRNQDYELFLYSKGYYLEWMRNSWLKDKNLAMLKLMISNPGKYMKKVAPGFVKYENQMEQEFWDSKVDPNKFSNNEN